MNKTELDRKYYPQYLELLNLVQEGLKIEVNTELDFNGDFIDKRVAFGYAIFVLERIRVEKVSARLNTKEVTVIYDEKVKIEDILKAIKTTSYEGVEISTKQSSN